MSETTHTGIILRGIGGLVGQSLFNSSLAKGGSLAAGLHLRHLWRTDGSASPLGNLRCSRDERPPS